MKRRYGRAHRLVRKAWEPRVASGTVRCARCGKLILPYERWHLDHDDDDPLQRRYLGPSHAKCNLRTVSHLKERLAEREMWSQEWHVGTGAFDARCPACRTRGSACNVALNVWA